MAKNTSKNWTTNPYYVVMVEQSKYPWVMFNLIHDIGDASRVLFTGSELGILCKDDDWEISKDKIIELVFEFASEAIIFTVIDALAPEPKILEDEHWRRYKKINGKPTLVYEK